MSDETHAVGSRSSWELDSVKDEWYRSRLDFGLQHIDFNRMNGRIELTLMEERGSEGGKSWRLHFADYLITNDHLDMLNDWLITPESVLYELYDEYLSLGESSDDLKEWNASIAAYGKAIAARPKEAEPYVALGLALMQTSEYEAAVAYLYAALSLLSSMESAAEDLETLAENQALEFRAHYAIAYSLDRVGRLSEAVKHYKIAYLTSPSQELADTIFSTLDEVFMISLADKNWEAAILLQRSKHDLKPDQLQLHLNLCSIYGVSGDPVSAKREGELAVKLYPNDFSALGNLAKVYAGLNDHHKAILYYERSLAAELSQADLKAHLKVAYAYSLLCLGSYSDAVLQIEETLKIDPQNAAATQFQQHLTAIRSKTH